MLMVEADLPMDVQAFKTHRVSEKHKVLKEDFITHPELRSVVCIYWITNGDLYFCFYESTKELEKYVVLVDGRPKCKLEICCTPPARARRTVWWSISANSWKLWPICSSWCDEEWICSLGGGQDVRHVHDLFASIKTGETRPVKNSQSELTNVGATKCLHLRASAEMRLQKD